MTTDNNPAAQVDAEREKRIAAWVNKVHLLVEKGGASQQATLWVDVKNDALALMRSALRKTEPDAEAARAAGRRETLTELRATLQDRGSHPCGWAFKEIDRMLAESPTPEVAARGCASEDWNAGRHYGLEQARDQIARYGAAGAKVDGSADYNAGLAEARRLDLETIKRLAEIEARAVASALPEWDDDAHTRDALRDLYNHVRAMGGGKVTDNVPAVPGRHTHEGQRRTGAQNFDEGRTCGLCGGDVPSGYRHEHGGGICNASMPIAPPPADAGKRVAAPSGGLRELRALIPGMLNAMPWGAYKGALLEDPVIRAALGTPDAEARVPADGASCAPAKRRCVN